MTTTLFSGLHTGSSFRDPAGRLVRVGDRILRLVSPTAQADVDYCLASDTWRSFSARGNLIGTRVVPAHELEALHGRLWAESSPDLSVGLTVLEHDVIRFPTFPYEWPPEMLHAAAGLTLELGLNALNEGMGLKDATPYNVLFRGCKPVFVDVLSFERRNPRDAIWLPYGQFVRTFLLPLLLHARLGMPLDQVLLARRDGVTPEEAYRQLGLVQRLLPPGLTLATLPVWIGANQRRRAATGLDRRLEKGSEMALFILRSLLRRLGGQLRDLTPVLGRRSTWSQYCNCTSVESPEYFSDKRTAVTQALAGIRPRRLLDVGCNSGYFSVLAARQGASVIAIDTDPVVVGQTWREAAAEQLDVLPLVVNLARPTPAVGWRNQECASFLDRARGASDTVLMLAILHHLMVSEGIQLGQVLSLAAELTTDALIIEFVPPEDPMFRALATGRQHLYAHLTRAVFETACDRWFEVRSAVQLGHTGRWLYVMHRKGQ